MNSYEYTIPKSRKEKKWRKSAGEIFFSGEVLSTLFGDDVLNGTPINFDEEDPDFRKRERGRAGKCRSESHPTV